LATVGGGYQNTSSGLATVGGGYQNTSSGLAATVPGGQYNTAAGDLSFAAGRRAKANHQGAFVWADSQNADFSSTANDQFLIRASGGVGIGTASPQQQLSVAAGVNIDQANANNGSVASALTFGSNSGEAIASKRTAGGNQDGLDFYTASTNRMSILNSGNVGIGTTAPGAMLQVVNATCDGTTWQNASDRALKENFEPVNAQEVLARLAHLPLSRWNYKHAPGQPHIGPMAQDFQAAFALGSDDKHISTVDEGGVALAAIQALNQKLEQKETEISKLKQRLEKMEQLLNSKLGGGAK